MGQSSTEMAADARTSHGKVRVTTQHLCEPKGAHGHPPSQKLTADVSIVFIAVPLFFFVLGGGVPL